MPLDPADTPDLLSLAREHAEDGRRFNHSPLSVKFARAPSGQEKQ